MVTWQLSKSHKCVLTRICILSQNIKSITIWQSTVEGYLLWIIFKVFQTELLNHFTHTCCELPGAHSQETTQVNLLLYDHTVFPVDGWKPSLRPNLLSTQERWVAARLSSREHLLLSVLANTGRR